MAENKYWEGCYVSEGRWLRYCKNYKRKAYQGLPVKIIINENTVMTPEEYWAAKEKVYARWVPKQGTFYFALTKNGEAVSHLFQEWSQYATYMYEVGNMFKTKKEAEDHLKAIKYNMQYRDYAKIKNKDFDFTSAVSRQTKKYFGALDLATGEIDVASCTTACIQGVVYFLEEQDVYEFIDLIGKDNYKKYILGA